MLLFLLSSFLLNRAYFSFLEWLDAKRNGRSHQRVYTRADASKIVGFDLEDMTDAEMREMMAQYDMITRLSQVRLQGRAMMEQMMNELGIEGEIIQN